MPSQPQFAFEIGDLLLRVGDLLIALDQFLSQLLVLAAKTVVFTLQVLRSYRLRSARLAMGCSQTYTLPGFSAHIQVQTQDF